MATRKKAKAKRRQAPARKPAARRKTAPVRKKPATRRKAAPVRKKPAKKAPARRAAPRKARPAARPAPAAKPAPAPSPAQPAQPAPPGQRIGVVTHYYSHLAVAVIRLSGTLRVGDTIHIRGHTTDFSQRVESLEVDHAPVAEVGPKNDFGLKVIEHVREHDVVYKV